MKAFATRTLLAFLAAALGAGALAPRARAEESVREHADTPPRADHVEDGEHWRLESDNGVVHVWRPPGYDPRTAGMVIYLHGHRSTADTSWSEHRMAWQFRQSGLNALFVVCDSTTDGEEDLHWESPGALRRFVARATGVATPPGPLVVMGHSGAFRNLVAWLDDREITDLILLDALYSHEDDFRRWIVASKDHHKKRLTLVSKDTRKNALRFMRGIPASVGVKHFPSSLGALNKRQRGAQVLNFRSQYDHMGIVTSGAVIPVVLQRSDLKPVGKKAPAEAPALPAPATVVENAAAQP